MLSNGNELSYTLHLTLKFEPFVSASAFLFVITFLLRSMSNLASGGNGCKKQHKICFSLLVNFARLGKERNISGEWYNCRKYNAKVPQKVYKLIGSSSTCT